MRKKKKQKADRFIGDSGSEDRQVPDRWLPQTFVPGDQRAGTGNGGGRLRRRAALSRFYEAARGAGPGAPGVPLRFLVGTVSI